MTKKTCLRFLAFAGAALLVPAGAGRASAQALQGGPPSEPAASETQEPQSYGTGSLSVYTVNSFAFEPFDSATVFIGDGSNGRVVTSGNNCFLAPVTLPSGAVIDHTELESCDTNGTFNVSAVLFACNLGACTTSYPILTVGTPGCAKLASAVTATTVQNNGSVYSMQACTGAAASTLAFKAVRVFYRLQVSPAPATATFPNDVPTTNAFYRFVEALAAAGITGGCGTGRFCPNDPVTRGQMAVFLSTALGLHFPN